MATNTINKAKDFLRTRLSAEQSMSKHLEEALHDAAILIAGVMKRYNINADSLDKTHNLRAKREIEQIIKRLIEELEEDVELLCVNANEEDKDHILAFVTGAVFGLTLASRLETWARKFVNEVASAVNSGIAPTYATNTNKGAAFGFKRLLTQTIAMAYMEELKRMNSNAIGFVAYRGSSYPCAVCQEYVDKGFQPMSEYKLPLHPNCCCYAVFIN